MSSGGVVRAASFKRARRGGGGGKKAVGAVFKDSLESLLRMLHATSPHFIRWAKPPTCAARPKPKPNLSLSLSLTTTSTSTLIPTLTLTPTRCVKPNFRQAAGAFDGAYVLQQLQMMGMIHVVHARKLGYAHRYPFERFRARYDYLWKGLERPSAAACAPYYSRHLGAAGAPDGERKDCTMLLAAMALSGQLDEAGWAVGISKVLLKAPQQQQLEVARESHLRRMVEAQLSNPNPKPPNPILDPNPIPDPHPHPHPNPNPNPIPNQAAKRLRQGEEPLAPKAPKAPRGPDTGSGGAPHEAG